jgi:hypothetical protein
MQLAHSLIQEPFAALASQDQKPHDRVPFQSGEPFRRADRAALK